MHEQGWKFHQLRGTEARQRDSRENGAWNSTGGCLPGIRGIHSCEGPGHHRRVPASGGANSKAWKNTWKKDVTA